MNDEKAEVEAFLKDLETAIVKHGVDKILYTTPPHILAELCLHSLRLYDYINTNRAVYYHEMGE